MVYLFSDMSNILDGELDAELDTEWLLLADDPLPLLLPLPLSILIGVTEKLENVWKQWIKNRKQVHTV